MLRITLEKERCSLKERIEREKMAGLTGEWQKALENEFTKPYYLELFKRVHYAYQTSRVFPPGRDLFRAFDLTPLSQVKVVILGQDPYHNDNQAMGLSFSVKKGIDIPPSLQNIYKEMKRDLDIDPPSHGDLTSWAKQGVFLLNSTLTVQAHKANSHKDMGWQRFTDRVIEIINQEDRPIVFMLWGSYARQKKVLLDNPKHLILESSHPSPLSVYRGFDGCGHFSKANEFLHQYKIEGIDWYIGE